MTFTNFTVVRDIEIEKLEKSIWYFNQSYQRDPSLKELATQVQLNSDRFQEVFSEWAGGSPKKFNQILTSEMRQTLLSESHQTPIVKAPESARPSHDRRVHNLFVSVEAMTPREFNSYKEDLRITYEFYRSPFGEISVASTWLGICHVSLAPSKKIAMNLLKQQFPGLLLIRQNVEIHRKAMLFFEKDWEKIKTLPLHLVGTPFQLKVWESLLKIPFGEVSTYGDIAHQINTPAACRAVGSAVGRNPIAFIVPCHRVIQKSGALGGFYWGVNKKAAILGWEAADSEILLG